MTSRSTCRTLRSASPRPSPSHSSPHRPRQVTPPPPAPRATPSPTSPTPPARSPSSAKALRSTTRVPAGPVTVYLAPAAAGGPPVPLIDSSGPCRTFFTSSLNDAGAVAVTANRDDGGQDVLLLRPGVASPVVVAHADPGPSVLFGQPDINSAGAVAFAQYDRASDTLAYLRRDPDGTMRELYTLPPDALRTGISTAVSLNDDGTAAFLLPGGADPARIVTTDGTVPGAVATIATTAGPFASFSAPALNDRGDIVFVATLDESAGGGLALYTGPDPLRDRVLGTGDPLFGSTVTDVRIIPVSALNDTGQIAFRYELANGQSGIALATPVPEPGMVGAGALLVSAAFDIRRRSRSSC